MKLNCLRIICVGSRFVTEDSSGPKVYDYLMNKELPDEISVIDGGLAGLNLLGLVEGAKRVVFVDSVEGFSSPGDVVVIDISDAALKADTTFGHNSGLAYLLKVIPVIMNSQIPEIYLIGIEGKPDKSLIHKAADMSLKIVLGKLEK